MYFVLLVLVVIIILFYSVEPYDNLLSNSTLENCSNWCKTTENCYGFAYDVINKKCFPSYNLLEGKPRESLYRDFYLPSNVSCNKIQPVIEPKLKDELTLDERRKNSIYVCREREDMQPSWFLHQNNTFLNIGEGKNLDEIYNVDVYDVRPYEWSKIKQTSVINKQNLEHTFDNKTVTNFDRVIQKDDIIYALPKQETKQTDNQQVAYDFGLNFLTFLPASLPQFS